MAEGKLIHEISSMERPERFKPRQVDEIVKKYILEGMTVADARKILAAEGLQFSDVKAKDRFPNCLDCDESAIAAGYKFGSFLPFLPTKRSLVIDIGFRDGKVAIIHGWYVTHVY